ncbi:small VCP/p97-interacting protein-like [Mya arenaria]|uniref:small VCP/p97-interacting protein-like n=1 Tax=Mya arenaria TaxID=6604 RepID=UPI0022E36E91|nr:small VCP/p97-interacting protein-like [Mya arenaria]
MGYCLSCFEGRDVDQPTPETRRRQMVAAAEQRQKANESRGLKDPEGFKMKQKRKAEAEKLADQPHGDTNLKWQVS